MTATISRLASSTLVVSLFLACPRPADAFIRGDVDGGGTINIGDAITLLQGLFQPMAPPFDCADAADTNDDGVINLADAVFLLAALFQVGAPTIPPPYPADGVDPTPDALPDCGLQGLLPFTTISQERFSGIMTATQQVIATAPEWSAFWTQHSADPLPTVDFTNEMVIAILGTYGNAGVNYDITEIEALSTNVEIRYTLTLPGAFLPRSEQPHHFVRCPKVTTTPVWVETLIALP